MSTSVLIVDDEKNIRLTLTATLQSMEFQTDTAINGEEALKKIGENDYDILLLDIKMPGLDGIQVLSSLRVIKPDISVIMITAHGTVDNAVEAMKLGAVDFLQKPFTPDEIRETITKVLDRQALNEKSATTYEKLMELANKYVGQRDFTQAAEYVRKALAESPQRPEAFNFLGALMEIKREIPEAQKFYRAAISLDPTYEPARINLDRTAMWDRTGKIIFD